MSLSEPISAPRRLPRSGSDPSSAAPLADKELDEIVSQSLTGHDLSRIPALNAFMRQMDKYPVLSSEAQLQLVARYQEDIRTVKNATRVTKAVQRAERRAEQDLHHLVACNFRLVILIARDQASKRYPSHDRLAEVLPDLVNEGNAALTEAVQKFDPARSPNFPSYAGRAIRDRIRWIISRESPMKMSSSWSRVSRIAAFLRPELATELGRSPSTEELQAALLERCLAWAEDKLTPAQREATLDEQHAMKLQKLRKQGMLGAIEHVDEILARSKSMVRLDAPSPSGDQVGLHEVIPEHDSGNLFDDVELDELREALRAALKPLSDRDRKIVLLRYGFGADGERWSYQRIADEVGVTAERIRQIENGVLDKLRAPGTTRSSLEGFLPSP